MQPNSPNSQAPLDPSRKVTPEEAVQALGGQDLGNITHAVEGLGDAPEPAKDSFVKDFGFPEPGSPEEEALRQRMLAERTDEEVLEAMAEDLTKPDTTPGNN